MFVDFSRVFQSARLTVQLIGPPIDEADFVKVLEMKGVRRPEMNQLMEAFHAQGGGQGKEGAPTIKPRNSASSLAATGCCVLYDM